MVKNNELKIAIISDIHFQMDNDFIREKTSDAFYNALKEVDFDYLIVNGDVSFRGSKKGFEDGAIFFNKLISKKENLSINDIFFVPGNHDTNRDIIKDEIFKNPDYKKFKRINKSKPESLLHNEFLTFENGLDKFKVPFQEYLNFLRGEKGVSFKPYTNQYKNTKSNDNWLDFICGYKIREVGENQKLIICCFNSSWYTSENDRGNLVLGTSMVQKNIKKIQKIKNTNNNCVVISCIHHQPEHLSWTENFIDKKNFLANFASIMEMSDIVITSDQHVPPESPTYHQTKNLIISTGSVHDSINHENSFKILNLNLTERFITIDDYISDKRNKEYKFNLNDTILKNGNRFEINKFFESRIFPLSIRLEDKINKEEEVFWYKNFQIINDEKNSINEKMIHSFIIKLYNRKFSNNFLFTKKIQDNIEQFTDDGVTIIAIELSELLHIYNTKNISNFLEKHIKGFSLVIISPYSIIKDKKDFKNNGIKMNRNNLLLSNIELSNDLVHIDEVQYLTLLEIREEKKDKIIIEKLNLSKKSTELMVIVA